MKLYLNRTSFTLTHTFSLSHARTHTTTTEAAPATVKLYLNRTSFSFDDAESVEPTQVLELTEEDYKADKVNVCVCVCVSILPM